ncbi:hypothetical protein HK104_009118 [Borealophlyctis nickersoniae]|nr:hypothetical protein HK104_009118 [Borealophlyctis nickersoniae]
MPDKTQDPPEDIEGQILRQVFKIALLFSAMQCSSKYPTRTPPQVEYYFSDRNLQRDEYLREAIDATPALEVPLVLLLEFPRLKALVTDVPTLAKVLRRSKQLVLSFNDTAVRRRVPFVYDPNYEGDICTAFKKGNCRFGAKCRYRHVKPVKPAPAVWRPKKRGVKIEITDSDNSPPKKRCLEVEINGSRSKKQRVEQETQSSNIPEEELAKEVDHAGAPSSEPLDTTAPPSDQYSTEMAGPHTQPSDFHIPPSLQLFQAAAPIFPPLGLASFASWRDLHFGPAARAAFDKMRAGMGGGGFQSPHGDAPGTGNSSGDSDATQESSSKSGGEWDSMCLPCQSYWKEYYKSEGWVEDGGHVQNEGYTGNGDVQQDAVVDGEYQEEHGDWNGYQGDDGDEVYADEEWTEYQDDGGEDGGENGTADGVEIVLTPEMIEMFRHSENWRKQKAEEKERERLLAQQKEQDADEEASRAAERAAEMSGFAALQRRYGEGAYRIACLEKQLDAQFAEHVQKAQPNLWPVLPIRWIEEHMKIFLQALVLCPKHIGRCKYHLKSRKKEECAGNHRERARPRALSLFKIPFALNLLRGRWLWHRRHRRRALQLHWEYINGEKVLEVVPDVDMEDLDEEEAGLAPGEAEGTREALAQSGWRQRLFTSLKFAGRFVNPFWEWKDKNATNIWEYLHWQLTRVNRNGVPKDERVLALSLPSVSPDFELLRSFQSLTTPEVSESWVADASGFVNTTSNSQMTLTWIGQSTCLIQMEGYNILTDPIFSERTVKWFGPRRLRPAPCKLSELPKIDIVLVSHNHYDHLDQEAVKELGNSVTWFIPVGLRDWFKRFGVTKVIELDWWQEYLYDSKLRIIGTPIQHWSGRHFFDVNLTLWCSFLVKGAETSFFHCGDTGYCSAFKEISRRYGPVTLAALPIGSYEPRWFLRHQHVSPEEAVMIHQDLQAQHTIGVHWGTFMMSDEHYLDPPKVLESCRVKQGLGRGEVFTTKIGETVCVPPRQGWFGFGEELAAEVSAEAA